MSDKRFVQKYPRGSRGSPAKGVASDTVARVQISSSAPKNPRHLRVGLDFFVCEKRFERVPPGTENVYIFFERSESLKSRISIKKATEAPPLF